MQLLRFANFLAGLQAAAAHVINDSSSLVLFERLHQIPAGWQSTRAPSPETQIKFTITLLAERPELLEQTLYDISKPGSPSYGKHLRHHELKRIVAPPSRGRSETLEWLRRTGAIIAKDDGHVIEVSTSVQNANAMLGTTFEIYEYLPEPQERKIRTLEVRLPRNVWPYVQSIHPTTYFEQVRPLRSVIHSVVDIAEETSLAANCATQITIKCLQDMYGIDSGIIKDPTKAGILGVPGFLGQIAQFADFDASIQSGSDQAEAGMNFTYSILNGGSMAQSSRSNSVEANLDIQYTTPLVSPMRTHFYAVGKKGDLIPDADQPDVRNSQNEPFAEFFTHLLDLKDKSQLPHTISISYGDNEQSVPDSYAKMVCNQIAQLGTLGVSVVAGSGDDGVGSACQTNDGKMTLRFTPIFPASCPFVTSVGGTAGMSPERAVGFSSGGFSDKWARPAYQDTAINSFLQQNGEKWKQYFNASGRGFPDVSAQANGFKVINNGRSQLVGGTSAAAPVVASIIALLNAQRLQNGQPALGFLNPWLYANAGKMLTDITAGKSTGCSGRSKHSYQAAGKIEGASWPAVKGWDPVTGLGTPRFTDMLASLPAV